jgi:putative flippase GtrA
MSWADDEPNALLPRPVRFVLASGTAAAVNFGARIVLNFAMPYAAAIVCAYACGMTIAFLLNRRFVFRGATNPMHQQAAWFAIVNAVAALQTLVVSLLLADWLLPRVGWTWHTPEVAHAVGICAPIVTSYLGHRRWTFRQSR